MKPSWNFEKDEPWPWCEACGSWHHPKNITCLEVKPMKDKHFEAHMELMSEIFEDLLDGAYWAALEDAAELYNDMNHIDSDDVFNWAASQEEKEE